MKRRIQRYLASTSPSQSQVDRAAKQSREPRLSQETSPKALGRAAEEAGAALYACRHPRSLDADEARAGKIIRPIRYG